MTLVRRQLLKDHAGNLGPEDIIVHHPGVGKQKEKNNALAARHRRRSFAGKREGNGPRRGRARGEQKVQGGVVSLSLSAPAIANVTKQKTPARMPGLVITARVHPASDRHANNSAGV
jgi:hypothetical protein